jgi:hypothetical protein
VVVDVVGLDVRVLIAACFIPYYNLNVSFYYQFDEGQYILIMQLPLKLILTS